MTNFLYDLRYAFRLLAKNPAFTAVAALTLAVGIGANGAIFSLTNALLLRPIAAASPDKLIRVSVTKPDGRRQARHSYLNYLDFRDTNQTLAALSAKNSATVSMTNGDASDQLVAEVVTGNYFEALGLRPAIGRLFTMNDDRAAADRVVVIGHHFWQTRFLGDPQIIGKTLRLNGEVFTVIGVTPSEFTGDSAGVFIDAWAPLLQVPSWAGVNWQNDRNADRLQLLGRRKAGVSLAQTQADLSAIAGRLASEYPLANQGKSVLAQQARFFDNQLRGPVSIFLAVVMALTGLVLLTACANLANLLLARAAGRRREMAIRLALGAGRGQLIRQVLCESLLLAVLGGAGGMIFGIWASDLLMNFNPLPASIPIRFDFAPDARVYGFLALLAATAGIVMGIAPALASSRVGVLGGLKDESGNLGGGVTKSRLRNLFVISQVALSLVVLVVAGLLLRSLGHARNIDLGFTPQNALAMDIDPKLKGWPEPRVLQYYRDVQQRLEAIPGVRQVAFANLAPMDLATPRIAVVIEGQQSPPGREPLRLSFNRVSPGYFSVVQVPLIKGRDFSELDDSQKPAVAIVNETMAQRFWPGRDPLGQRFRLVRENDLAFESATGGATVEIIGVARNARYRSLGEEPEAHFYVPYLQNFAPSRTLLVRTAGDPGPMIGKVQLALQAIDSDLPGFFSRTLEQHAGLALVPARMGAALAGIFGALALLLATVGLYSVVAYTAARRTREIGIRVALGASRRQILSLILGHGMRMVWMGCGLGIAAALALTRFLSALLYGVSPSDIPTYAAVAAILLAVALLACWIPARRATRVDPMVALRYE